MDSEDIFLTLFKMETKDLSGTTAQHLNNQSGFLPDAAQEVRSDVQKMT